MRPEASAPLQTARFPEPEQSGIIPLPLQLFVSRSRASSWPKFLIVHSVVRFVYNTVVIDLSTLHYKQDMTDRSDVLKWGPLDCDKVGLVVRCNTADLVS